MSKEQLPEQYDDVSEEFGTEEYDADIDTGDSPVAASNTNKIMGIIILVILIAGVLFFTFSGEDQEELEAEEKKIEVYDLKSGPEGEAFNVAPEPVGEIDPVLDTISPEEEVISDVVTLDVPELPDLQVSALPSTEDFNIEPEFQENDLFDQMEEKIDAENKEEEEDRGLVADIMPIILNKDEPERQVSTANEAPASMMLINGGDITESSESGHIPITSAETISATKIEFPDRTIAQGKLVDSVLETAVNTDLEGNVRAIVSRDVYADFGKAILIPKGSRLIGSYSGSTSRGQTRVLITWDRLIRPDAVDIMINSPASDQFGRSGVPGSVDNKYLELFNNSILLSLITIGTAMAIESSTNTSGVTETTDSNGDSTTVATPSDIAAQEIINSISDTAKTVLDGVLNVNPTITIPHGTRIKVFVNQDLVFPKESFGGGQDGTVFIR